MTTTLGPLHSYRVQSGLLDQTHELPRLEHIHRVHDASGETY